MITFRPLFPTHDHKFVLVFPQLLSCHRFADHHVLDYLSFTYLCVMYAYNFNYMYSNSPTCIIASFGFVLTMIIQQVPPMGGSVKEPDSTSSTSRKEQVN